MSQTDEIKNLLRSSATQSTDEFESAAQQAKGFTRYIDVTITDVPEGSEAPPVVDGHLTEMEQDEPTAEPTQEPEAAAPQTQPIPVRPRTRRPVAVVVMCFCLLLLAGIATVLIAPLIAPQATITITPKSRQLQLQATLHLPGRTLANVTMKQSQSAATTGTHHQDAKAAQGAVIFYNAAPYTQTIAAGTLLTGTDGILIITDQDAIIPSVIYPTLGQARVLAHAVVAGPASNIAAGDIYGPCCRLNVSAVNTAFSGGQDQRSYQTPTQQDINNLKASMQESIDTSIEAALQAQTQKTETLIQPFTCQIQMTTDHQPGEEATTITGEFEETCSAMVYNTAVYQEAVTEQGNQQASTQLGDGYSLISPLQSSIRKSSNKQKSVDLQVRSTATYAYQFSQDQQQRIKALVAGKSREQATTALLQIPGIQAVSFSLNNQATIPTERNQIHLVFLLSGWGQ